MPISGLASRVNISYLFEGVFFFKGGLAILGVLEDITRFEADPDLYLPDFILNPELLLFIVLSGDSYYVSNFVGDTCVL